MRGGEGYVSFTFVPLLSPHACNATTLSKWYVDGLGFNVVSNLTLIWFTPQPSSSPLLKLIFGIVLLKYLALTLNKLIRSGKGKSVEKVPQ